MKPLAIAVVLALALIPVRAFAYEITSPSHAQTFTFGSERGRQWLNVNGHLAVLLHLTNDPYVSREEPRQYDDFTFDFPNVRLGSDGRTFYYQPPGKGNPVPIAVRRPGFLGDDIDLLPNAELLIEKPHGYLTLHIAAGRHPIDTGAE